MPPTCPPHFLWWAESFKINGLIPPTELCGALWWACGAHWWLNYLVDNLFAAIPHIHLFSGYLLALKQRGNSVLAIIGAHPPKLLDQIAMLNAFFPGLLNVAKHLLNICFGKRV